MTLQTLLLVCALCASEFGAVKLPPGAAIYDKFPEELRPALIEGYQHELKRVEGELSKASDSLTKATSAQGDDALRNRRDALNAELKALQEVNDPPCISSFMDGLLTSGRIGLVRDSVDVIQVRGATEAHVFKRVNGQSFGQSFILKGVSTKNWGEDKHRKIEGPFWVSGTVNIGGSPFLIVEPFDWGRYQKSLESEKKANVREEP